MMVKSDIEYIKCSLDAIKEDIKDMPINSYSGEVCCGDILDSVKLIEQRLELRFKEADHADD